MSRLYQYDPAKIKVSVAFNEIEGFAEDMVSIKLNQPNWSLVTGVNGESTRVRNLDTSGTIVLSLLQGSQANNYLSLLAQLDYNLGVGVFPVTIMDRIDAGILPDVTAGTNSAGFKLFCPKSYIRSLPEVSFGKSHKVRRWEITCSSLFYWVGSGEEAEGNLEGDKIKEAIEEYGNQIKSFNN